MKIKDFYYELKSADDLVSSNLHHKLSAVLKKYNQVGGRF